MNSTAFRGLRIHLMGIGGAGMSALVPLLREVGAFVEGCDLSESTTVRRLRAEGIPVAHGHDPAHVDDCDMLIYSSAVPQDHEQLRAARSCGIPVLSRPAALAELMRGTRTIAIAGSHGKTSTTWMLGHLLVEQGLDPVVMVGGSLDALGGGGSRVGRSSLFIAEVDESDGGFRHVEPELAVVTNLEAEHIRHYGSFAGLCDAFHDWLGGMGPSGVAVLPAEGLDSRVTDGLPCRIVRVGFASGDVHAADLALDAEGSRFRLQAFGRDHGLISVASPGRHMVQNALNACAAALVLAPGCDLGRLADCERVRRRFTVHGEHRGVRVVEDYGHHPTEVRAAIAAAALAKGRVHVIVQPHRFTRLADCFSEFVTAFDVADTVAVLPVYAAGEEPIPGRSGRDLAEAISAHRDVALLGHKHEAVQYTPKPAIAQAFVSARAEPGDTILVLGAGDVGRLCPALVQGVRA